MSHPDLNIYDRIEIRVKDPFPGSRQVFEASFDQYDLCMIQRYVNKDLLIYRNYCIANCSCVRSDVADAILAELIRQGWIVKPQR